MFFQHLSRTLHPVLVSTFLDCASSVFTPDGKQNDTETMMVVAVSRLVSLLYGTLLSGNENVGDRGWLFIYFLILSQVPSSTLSELENFLGYMTPYFPFSPTKSRDIRVRKYCLFVGESLTMDLGYWELPGFESRILWIDFPTCPSFELYLPEPLVECFINTKAAI
jgi:hypothetical protein